MDPWNCRFCVSVLQYESTFRFRTRNRQAIAFEFSKCERAELYRDIVWWRIPPRSLGSLLLSATLLVYFIPVRKRHWGYSHWMKACANTKTFFALCHSLKILLKATSFSRSLSLDVTESLFSGYSKAAIFKFNRRVCYETNRKYLNNNKAWRTSAKTSYFILQQNICRKIS